MRHSSNPFQSSKNWKKNWENSLKTIQTPSDWREFLSNFERIGIN